ncbi:MAG: hypothetical protein H7831_03770 [Magnetococcus sp. WYHC-3]
MRCAAIIELGAEVTVETLPAAVRQGIGALAGEWPAGTMPGTRIHAGRRLVLVMLRLADAAPLAQLEGLLAQLGLDWQVRALLGANGTAYRRPDMEALVAFQPDVPLYGEDNGDPEGPPQTGTRRPLPGEIPLATWAGWQGWA